MTKEEAYKVLVKLRAWRAWGKTDQEEKDRTEMNEEELRAAVREKLTPLIIEYNNKIFETICELSEKAFMAGFDLGTNFEKIDGHD